MRFEKTSLLHGFRIIAITRAIMMDAKQNRDALNTPAPTFAIEAADTEPSVFFAEETTALA